MLDTALFEPNASVRHLNVPENRGRWEFVELALRGLVAIRRKGRDVDEPGHPRIDPGVRDQRAAIRVADEDRRAMDASKTSFHGGDISRE